MEKVKCDYCGEEYEEAFMVTWDNGSPACPECAAKEQETHD